MWIGARKKLNTCVHTFICSYAYDQKRNDTKRSQCALEKNIKHHTKIGKVGHHLLMVMVQCFSYINFQVLLKNRIHIVKLYLPKKNNIYTSLVYILRTSKKWRKALKSHRSSNSYSVYTCIYMPVHSTYMCIYIQPGCTYIHIYERQILACGALPKNRISKY